MTLSFPPDFIWGSATASFQIEGATREDGRGESIWDRFAATPGKISTGETGDPACDSYHLYMDDIALLRTLKVDAYRFSIAWPRVIPTGDGAVNPVGLGYYDRLVDALLEAGITPYATLYHWDLPQALQDTGGWANRATIDAFVRYADMTVSHLGDRVKQWATFNEPWCASILSNLIGEHAPGLHDCKTALAVAHHLLVAHGKAVPVIRDRCPDASIGIVLNFEPSYPATDSEADARLTRLHHDHFNRWFLDPLMGRGYPTEGWEAYGADVPEIAHDDIQIIGTPIDFLGVNYYSRTVHHDPNSSGNILNQRDPNAVTARNWEIFPQGLYDLLIWLHQDYQIARLLITENGMACNDALTADAQVHDSERIDFIKGHLEMVLKAINAGANVQGYFYWSLLDNFEWAWGTSSRFGLAYTNFDTQERILKDSAHWYARVVEANSIIE